MIGYALYKWIDLKQSKKLWGVSAIFLYFVFPCNFIKFQDFKTHDFLENFTIFKNNFINSQPVKAPW